MTAKILASLASKSFAGLAGAGMALTLQLSHAAPLLNAGFESGNLTGWNIGAIQDAGWGVVSELTTPPLVPTQGGFMAMVSNAGQVGSGIQLINHGLPPGVVNGAGGTPGTLPVPIFNGIMFPPPNMMDLVRFCVLPGILFDCAPSSVAELWQTFSVDGASTLRFDWNFLSNEGDPSFVDFAFVNIFGPSGQLIQLLARSPGGFGNLPPAWTGMSIDLSAQAAGQYGFQTGWQHSDFALSEPGDYTFALGVVGGGDTLFSSALLIDNVQVVPEPAILALLGLGLAGLVFSRRRNKKS